MKARKGLAVGLTTFVLVALAAAGAALTAEPALPLAADEPGEAVFGRWCAGCHGRLDEHRKQLAGTYALEQRYKGTRPAALEDRTDLTAELVRTMVRHGLNVMPPSRKTEISDAQLEQLVHYLTARAR
jgi:mono/diheme cytochrome c family protein